MYSKIETSLPAATSDKLIKLLNSKHMGYGVLRNFLYVGKTKAALDACEESIRANEEERKILDIIYQTLKDEAGGR